LQFDKIKKFDLLIGALMKKLSNLSYHDLIAQRNALDKQIENLRAAERQSILDELRQKIVFYEIDLADLGGSTGQLRVKRPVAPKYRHPESGATWTGRGRQPRWLYGENPEHFLIKK
jgi:DNA-binding protein H-NS